MGAKRQKRGGDQRSEQLKSVGKNRMNLGIVQVVRDKRQACYRRQVLQEIRISGQIDKQCVSSLNDSEIPEEIKDRFAAICIVQYLILQKASEKNR